jgi:hypothetical protein
MGKFLWNRWAQVSSVVMANVKQTTKSSRCEIWNEPYWQRNPLEIMTPLPQIRNTANFWGDSLLVEYFGQKQCARKDASVRWRYKLGAGLGRQADKGRDCFEARRVH